MRVIRTEMYFASAVVAGLAGIEIENPGIACAWFRNEADDIVDFSELLNHGWKGFDLERIDEFIAAALLNFRVAKSFRPAPGQIMMRSSAESFARYILEQTVVIEQSPPEGVPFNALLKNASGAVIGTYIGVQVVGDHSLLLLLTVPGGIMLVSSAIGISNALEHGFNKIVAAAFKKK